MPSCAFGIMPLLFRTVIMITERIVPITHTKKVRITSSIYSYGMMLFFFVTLVLTFFDCMASKT